MLKVKISGVYAAMFSHEEGFLFNEKYHRWHVGENKIHGHEEEGSNSERKDMRCEGEKK